MNDSCPSDTVLLYAVIERYTCFMSILSQFLHATFHHFVNILKNMAYFMVSFVRLLMWTSSCVWDIVLLDRKDVSGAVSASVNIFKQYSLTYTPAFITSRYFLPGVAMSYTKGSKEFSTNKVIFRGWKLITIIKLKSVLVPEFCSEFLFHFLPSCPHIWILQNSQKIY